MSLNFFLQRARIVSFLLCIIIFFTMLGYFIVTSYAQQAKQGLNLTVSPTFLDLSDTPGKTLTGKIRVRNNGSQAVTLAVSVDKLASDINGKITPAKAQASDTYLSWLTFDKSTITAPPQEWTDIPYTLTIPDDAAFGYYYAIHLGQTSGAVKTNANTKLLGEVIVPVLLDVKKDGTVKEARLVEFKPAQFVNEYLPVAFDVTMQNTGNVHLKPTGNIFIRGTGEKDLGVLDVNASFGSILPSSKRLFTSNWSDGFLVQAPVIEDNTPVLDKNGKPKTQLQINWNKVTNFRIGKYTANLLMVYDNGKRDVPIEASTTFWVIPYTALTVLAVSLIILILIIRFLLKWYIKNQVRKYQNK